MLARALVFLQCPAALAGTLPVKLPLRDIPVQSLLAHFVNIVYLLAALLGFHAIRGPPQLNWNADWLARQGAVFLKLLAFRSLSRPLFY